VGPYGWVVNTEPGGMAFGATFQDQFLKYLAFDPPNPTYDFRSFDIARDYPRLSPRMRNIDSHTARIDGFAARGGKLLLWHGTNDPAVSSPETVRFYERNREHLGSTTESAVKLYLAPGVQHCGGGTGPSGADLLAVMQEWVENGKAPGHLLSSGTRPSGAPRSLPLCQYPATPRHAGHGNIYDAASFTCSVEWRVQHCAIISRSQRCAGSAWFRLCHTARTTVGDTT
jgi:feruloyl esterase